MRGPNWMTAILLAGMALVFISAITWLIIGLVRKNKKKDAESNSEA